MISLIWKSLRNRKATALLTLVSIAVSVALVLSIHRIQKGTQESFSQTISGTDLIVGSKSGAIQLLLYTVFRLGAPTNNIRYSSFEKYSAHPEVKWTIPISLGDSHRGFRVIGTSEKYFEFYRFGDDRSLELAEGKKFSDLFDTVIGSQVARELGYKIGDEIVLSHGVSEAGIQEHDRKPFQISGILAPTGTPVDRSVHISLEGIEALHVDWKQGARPKDSEAVAPEQLRQMDLNPTQLTAFLIGLNSKFGLFKLQREINRDVSEPLQAVVPGATFSELWKTISIAEAALQLVGVFVVLAGLIGLLIALLTSLNERRREMAILRSVGAKPIHVFALLSIEAFFLSLIGALLGAGSVQLVTVGAAQFLQSEFGLQMTQSGISVFEVSVVLCVALAGGFIGLIPAYKAYRNTLADGLVIRL